MVGDLRLHCVLNILSLLHPTIEIISLLSGQQNVQKSLFIIIASKKGSAGTQGKSMSDTPRPSLDQGVRGGKKSHPSEQASSSTREHCLYSRCVV